MGEKEMRKLDEHDRVRSSTDERAQHKVDRAIIEVITRYANEGPDSIGRRLEELDGESDVERVLEINASTLTLIGIALAVFVSPWFLFLSAVVMTFLLQHGIQGWCPPLPVLRRLGIRTRREIDVEKYALKALRGDFEPVVAAGGTSEKARVAIEAATP